MDTPESNQLRPIPGWWSQPHQREILNEALLRIPHPMLYHYTPQAGLIGISRSNEIWATHTQYLNDHCEFRHALGIFREEIEALTSPGGKIEWLNCIEEMCQEVQDEFSNMNVCVVSFSEKCDSLSHWRAYASSAVCSASLPRRRLH